LCALLVNQLRRLGARLTTIHIVDRRGVWRNTMRIVLTPTRGTHGRNGTGRAGAGGHGLALGQRLGHRERSPRGARRAARLHHGAHHPPQPGDEGLPPARRGGARAPLLPARATEGRAPPSAPSVDRYAVPRLTGGAPL